jgi:hypothetical protein
LALQAALAARDPHRFAQLLGQWVHRHGVSSVEALLAALAEVDPEGDAWWHNRAPEPERVVTPEPVAAPKPVAVPELPRRASRPAPAPTHPVLVQLRSWLPDQETRRAA